RLYYIFHLYQAQEWERLFAVLDEGAYGKAKGSRRLYATDLNLGQQVIVRREWTEEEGVALVPRLWSYTLLRTSLASEADKYPPEAFTALIALKQEKKALDLV